VLIDRLYLIMYDLIISALCYAYARILGIRCAYLRDIWEFLRAYKYQYHGPDIEARPDIDWATDNIETEGNNAIE